jgi:hypothetical protein
MYNPLFMMPMVEEKQTKKQQEPIQKVSGTAGDVWTRMDDAAYGGFRDWSAGGGGAGPDLSAYATIVYVNTEDALKVNKAGDIMTGLITCTVVPSAVGHLTNKAYVDAAIAAPFNALRNEATQRQTELTRRIVALETKLAQRSA